VRRGRVLWIIAMIVAPGALTAALVSGIQADTSTNVLRREVTMLQHQLKSAQTLEQSDVTGLDTQVGSLSSQLANLNQPTDPLSAYNQICRINDVNSTTGLYQTYYYPCTNNIIPAAGN
jgi:hypothetical protein